MPHEEARGMPVLSAKLASVILWAMPPREPSRRDVLRLAGVGGAALLARGCGDNITTRPPGAQHAAAMFEPDDSSFVASVWSPLARTATIDVRDASGATVRTIEVALRPSALAVIDGLAASSEYRVTITTDDAVLLGPHRVRTAPAVDDPRPVRLAVSADLDQNPEFESDLFDWIAAADPELFVSIGDVPYTDNGPPAMDVATYRERHGQLRTTPRVRGWYEAMAHRAIYDDHEFRNDWDAHWVEVEASRYAAAMQVWDEFFPLPALQGEVRYRRFRWGANVECFLLDCRRFRSADAAPDDAQKTMLGAVQKQWLLDGLAQSTATFKLVFTSVPLDFGIGDDHWATFSTERDQIFTAIDALQTPGVLFLSGDQHYFAAYQHAYGLREFQVGPLARGLGTPGRDAPGVLFRDVRYNFGLLDIAGDQLTMSGIGPGGDVFYKETISAADLTPR
jgi:alkaline phosphatase D